MWPVPQSPQQPLMYDVDDENLLTTEPFRIEFRIFLSLLYVRVDAGFLPACSRAFARPAVWRSTSPGPHGEGSDAGGWAGEQTAKATGTAVCGESYRLRPAKVTQPSLVGGRRRPCLCLVPPPDAPAHTGRAHVTLTFGSQVYYQYYVLVLAITMG